MFGIYQTRPIAAWTFTIGALLVVAWSLWSRATASNAPAAYDTGATIAPPSDAQINAQAAVEVANIQSQDAAAARADTIGLETFKTAVGAQLATIGYQLDDRQGQRDLALGQANIDSNAYISVRSLQSQDHYIDVQGEVAKTQTQSERDVEIARENAAAQTTQALVSGSVQTAQVNAAAQAAIAKAASKKSKSFSFGPLSFSW